MSAGATFVTTKRAVEALFTSIVSLDSVAAWVGTASDFNSYDSLDQSGNVIKELTDKGHKMRVLGEGFTQTGFAKFASPIAITKHGNEFRAGVDTFHAAHAEGMSK